ncbi:MAG: DUF29 domain-containing protein [Cyanosarcina radialis HA8281-LM2]|jgi:hypothetical protein|nr:DUF29 domain-containing protein [Cyanosarcina radialis HA8281-LM2]
MISTLYDRDYYLWLVKTAQLLRDSRLSELDIPNLVEEIEDMGKSEKRAVESNLEVVLMHLLKYKYQPAKRTNSWLLTLFEHRRRLDKYLTDSPSLTAHLKAVFADCYNAARKKAAIETELPIETFPEASPFSLEEVLDPDYLPE